jgi:hypothetical protein
MEINHMEIKNNMASTNKSWVFRVTKIAGG